MSSSYMLKAFGIVCGIVFAAAAAAAGQISCTKSDVDFDRAVFSGPFDFVCKKDEIAGDAPAGSGDEAVVDRAFAPAGSAVNGILMSGRDGKYGNAFLITAQGDAKLGEPRLRNAIEAKVRLFGDKAGSVTWEDERQIGAFDVDFFRLTLPQAGSAGGARECIGFVRYVDGNATSHERRVLGNYCEIGVGPFDNDKAARVLNAVIVRLDPQ
jgi:hypothetical protein